MEVGGKSECLHDTVENALILDIKKCRIHTFSCTKYKMTSIAKKRGLVGDAENDTVQPVLSSNVFSG